MLMLALNVGIFSSYLSILRIDHWTKNLLIFPGLFFSYSIQADTEQEILTLITRSILGFALICLASSANYCLNEFCDSKSDSFHPRKKSRASVTHQVQFKVVVILYLSLAMLALFLSMIFSGIYGITVCIVYLFLAALYNIKPIRLKDRRFLDILCESANNPIRLIVGWQIHDYTSIPPLSILMAFWLIGSFLMGAKRISELDELRGTISEEDLHSYRKSLSHYTITSLNIVVLTSSHLGIALLIIFSSKYEFRLLPFCLVLCVWLPVFFSKAISKGRLAQSPERLLFDRTTLLFSFFALFSVVLTFSEVVNLELIRWFLESKILKVEEIFRWISKPYLD
jgi:4-hydroxybenzoate polyprenyltransferase